METANIFAFGAAGSWGLASLLYSQFSRKASPVWMNCFKACVGLTYFTLAILFTSQWSNIPDLTGTGLLFLSGMIGLLVGDLFLMKAFAEIGPTKTLIIFRCHPIILAIGSYAILSQSLSGKQLLGILILIACAFLFSYESKRKSGHWETRGILYALIGVTMDAIGVMITRSVFDQTPGLTTFEANFLRCSGAVMGFIVLNQFRPIKLIQSFRSFRTADKPLAFGAVFIGTFVTLSLWTLAVSQGTLAVVSAIWGLSPLFAAVFESLYEKQWPTRYTVFALLLSVWGFYLIT